MGRARQDPLGRQGGVVFGQIQGGCHVVCGAQGDIAQRRRVFQLHEPGHHLAEGAVAAHAGDHIVFRTQPRGHLRGVAPVPGEDHRGAAAAVIQGFHRVGKVLFVCAAACGGVHDQKQLAVHPVLSFQGIPIDYSLSLPTRQGLSEGSGQKALWPEDARRRKRGIFCATLLPQNTGAFPGQNLGYSVAKRRYL